MGGVITVEPSTLREASGSLGQVEPALLTAGRDVATVGGASDPNVQAGLQAVAVTWSAAIEVVAADVRLLAGEVGRAAERYDQADHTVSESTSSGQRPH
jgi:hypothetical protein